MQKRTLGKAGKAGAIEITPAMASEGAIVLASYGISGVGDPLTQVASDVFAAMWHVAQGSQRS